MDVINSQIRQDLGSKFKHKTCLPRYGHYQTLNAVKPMPVNLWTHIGFAAGALLSFYAGNDFRFQITQSGKALYELIG